MENSTSQILATKNQILNKILDVSAIFMGILFIINIVRAYNYGFDIVNILYVIILAFAFFIIFNKQKLSYNNKLIFFISLQLISCSIGIISFGVVGTNFFFFLSSVICTALFGNKKSTNIILYTGIAVYSFSMFLYVNHVIELRFSTEDFAHKISNWLNLIFTGSIVIFMLKTIVEELLGRLIKLNAELEKRYLEVKNLNESLEQKVEDRTEELNKSNKEKDRILGIISHDVNNRIGGIGSLLEILEQEDMNSEEQKEFIKLASDTCNSTTEIIKDLLEYSKNIGDQNELFLEKVNIHDFLKSSVNLHSTKAIKKGISIQLKENKEIIECNLNKLKFSRVMDNLISNAIKFTPEKGNILIEYNRDSNNLLISVKDSGIGIPENIKDKIFIPFSGSGRSGTNNEESNGLGLSIVKNIVEKHKGDIWFDSKPNVGTTFIIQLPL